MKLSSDILNELKELSPFLAGIDKTNVFTVPDGYFINLDETILASVKEDGIALVNGISKDVLFEAPQGYFENLPGEILNKIKTQQDLNTANELRVLSPMLYSIQNENVFETPTGYFNSIADNILNKVKPQPAKVVVMHKRNAFFKYAYAAVIIGVLALGVYKFISKPNHTSTNQLTVASLGAAFQTGIKMNATQFDQTLNTLSEDDIANYLEKNGTEADMSELSSNIDDNSLPNPDQYFSDDNTLDKYLDDNTKQLNN